MKTPAPVEWRRGSSNSTGLDSRLTTTITDQDGGSNANELQLPTLMPLEGMQSVEGMPGATGS
jgi:hypothetical protein